MPIYEYECQKCHHLFEKIQGFSDELLKKCPECGKESLKKCITASNFQLKGTGWYETDFKKQKKTESSTAESKPKESDKKKDKPKETNEG